MSILAAPVSATSANEKPASGASLTANDYANSEKPASDSRQSPDYQAAVNGLRKYKDALNAATTELKTYTESVRSLNKTNALSARRESNRDYLIRSIIGLISPMTLLVVFALLFFRTELQALAGSLQSLKIGPVELARTAISEIKAEIDEGNLRFEVGSELIAISGFVEYPQRIQSGWGFHFPLIHEPNQCV